MIELLLQKRAEKKEAGVTSQKLKTIEESSPIIKKKPALLKASSLQPNMGNVLAEMQKKGITKKSTSPRISDFPDDESNVSLKEKERIEKERYAIEQQARVAEEEQRVEQERYAMEQQAREEQQRLEKERYERERYAIEQQAREASAAAAAMRQAQEQRLQNERYEMGENAIEVEFHSSNAASKPQVPKETRHETRREIMNRRRRRMNSAAAPTAPPITPPSRTETGKVTATQMPTDPQSSHTAARAAARDRYARHKKMIADQQRNTSNTTTKYDDDNRTFSC